MRYIIIILYLVVLTGCFEQKSGPTPQGAQNSRSPGIGDPEAPTQDSSFISVNVGNTLNRPISGVGIAAVQESAPKLKLSEVTCSYAESFTIMPKGEDTPILQLDVEDLLSKLSRSITLLTLSNDGMDYLYQLGDASLIEIYLPNRENAMFSINLAGSVNSSPQIIEYNIFNPEENVSLKNLNLHLYKMDAYLNGMITGSYLNEADVESQFVIEFRCPIPAGM